MIYFTDNNHLNLNLDLKRRSRFKSRSTFKGKLLSCTLLIFVQNVDLRRVGVGKKLNQMVHEKRAPDSLVPKALFLWEDLSR